MENIVKLKTGHPIEEKHSHSRLVMVDNLIFMSICSGVDPSTGEMPSHRIKQTKQAIDNISHSLEKVGSGLSDIVRMIVTIPRHEDIYPIMDYVGEVFRGIDPVMSLYCGDLGSDRFALEIEVTAYKGAGAREVTVIDSGLYAAA